MPTLSHREKYFHPPIHLYLWRAHRPGPKNGRLVCSVGMYMIFKGKTERCFLFNDVTYHIIIPTKDRIISFPVPNPK